MVFGCLESRLLLLMVHLCEGPRLVGLLIDEVWHELVVDLFEVHQRDDLTAKRQSQLHFTHKGEPGHELLTVRGHCTS